MSRTNNNVMNLRYYNEENLPSQDALYKQVHTLSSAAMRCIVTLDEPNYLSMLGRLSEASAILNVFYAEGVSDIKARIEGGGRSNYGDYEAVVRKQIKHKQQSLSGAKLGLFREHLSQTVSNRIRSLQKSLNISMGENLEGLVTDTLVRMSKDHGIEVSKEHLSLP